jgi:hypothetical protein
MDVAKILGELRQERDQVDEVISGLARLLVKSRGLGRGRPPAWMAAVNRKRLGRPPGSKSKPAAKAAVIAVA